MGRTWNETWLNWLISEVVWFLYFQWPYPEQSVKARAALAFLLSERENFFWKFVLDEVRSYVTASGSYLRTMSCTWHINSLDKSKCWSKFPTKAFLFSALQIMKVTDAISREQLIQIAASFGIGNATPVFSKVNVRAGHCFQQSQMNVEQCRERTYLVHIWYTLTNKIHIFFLKKVHTYFFILL